MNVMKNFSYVKKRIREGGKSFPVLLTALAVLAVAAAICFVYLASQNDPLDARASRWDGLVWTNTVLGLRYIIPESDIVLDPDVLNQRLNEGMGQEGKAPGRVLFAVMDGQTGSNIVVYASRNEVSGREELLEKIEAKMAETVGRSGSFKKTEDLSVAGLDWDVWQVELSEQSVIQYYLYASKDGYLLNLALSSRPGSDPFPLLDGLSVVER